MARAAFRANEWIISTGALLFIAVLFISAYWESDIRWLHFFQAWMYVATIALIWKGNKWGYFVGVGVSALWNYMTPFVNPFLKNGLDQASILVRTGIFLVRIYSFPFPVGLATWQSSPVASLRMCIYQARNGRISQDS